MKLWGIVLFLLVSPPAQSQFLFGCAPPIDFSRAICKMPLDSTQNPANPHFAILEASNPVYCNVGAANTPIKVVIQGSFYFGKVTDGSDRIALQDGKYRWGVHTQTGKLVSYLGKKAVREVCKDQSHKLDLGVLIQGECLSPLPGDNFCEPISTNLYIGGTYGFMTYTNAEGLVRIEIRDIGKDGKPGFGDNSINLQVNDPITAYVFKPL